MIDIRALQATASVRNESPAEGTTQRDVRREEGGYHGASSDVRVGGRNCTGKGAPSRTCTCPFCEAMR